MVKLAKNAIIDTVGVTLAGWNEPVVQKVKKVYMTELGSNAAASSLWGEQAKASCENAAIINGTASHALDFDDAAPGVVIHPSAPILAAVIPLAELMGNSGREVISAYAIGTEVMIRIGQILGFKHYDLGWHATGTLGTIGAAAACCSLLKLNETEIAHAVAISASMAGGLLKNFGTNTKPLHVGLAASHAIQSTLLTKNGFTETLKCLESADFFMHLAERPFQKLKWMKK
ncbi:MmgE/PrpD family protein [Neobacillus cucumis]|uniref:MmgE/PrpD family protein n=1 Tax=Neobacillus cucumis TaxID=1740721 RepID=UPI002E21CFB2|nr:MmgE/PrpD family protein [Neobacillus cucumis]